MAREPPKRESIESPGDDSDTDPIIPISFTDGSEEPPDGPPLGPDGHPDTLGQWPSDEWMGER